MQGSGREMLVSQLEDDVGKEWLAQPYGAFVQEYVQRSRFMDVQQLLLAAVTHASVKLSQFGWAVVRSRPDG